MDFAFLKNIDMSQLLIIGLVIFLMLKTGTLNIGSILNILKPPTPTPGPGPTPGPDPQVNLMQLLLNLLVKARNAKDAEGEKSVLATMQLCCDNKEPHVH